METSGLELRSCGYLKYLPRGSLGQTYTHSPKMKVRSVPHLPGRRWVDMRIPGWPLHLLHLTPSHFVLLPCHGCVNRSPLTRYLFSARKLLEHAAIADRLSIPFD